MYKKIILGFSILLFMYNSKAQSNIDSTGYALQKIALLIQNDSVASNRFKADSIFTKQLIQTLKYNRSFYFSFDSLTAVKHILAPDSSFSVFSWHLDLGDGTYRQRAAIQFPTNDGSLKLIPLFDNSDFIENPTIGINNNKKWIGAVYYDIILTEYNHQKFYTLLGYDEYNLTISRKIIEVLHFEKNEPIFGGDFFQYPPDDTYPITPVHRFIINYKKGSNAYIRFDKETKHLVVSELASTENNLKALHTLVPSGNEVFFEWKQGKWEMTPSKIYKNKNAH